MSTHVCIMRMWVCVYSILYMCLCDRQFKCMCKIIYIILYIMCVVRPCFWALVCLCKCEQTPMYVYCIWICYMLYVLCTMSKFRNVCVYMLVTARWLVTIVRTTQRVLYRVPLCLRPTNNLWIILYVSSLSRLKRKLFWYGLTCLHRTEHIIFRLCLTLTGRYLKYEHYSGP